MMKEKRRESERERERGWMEGEKEREICEFIEGGRRNLEFVSYLNYSTTQGGWRGKRRERFVNLQREEEGTWNLYHI